MSVIIEAGLNKVIRAQNGLQEAQAKLRDAKFEFVETLINEVSLPDAIYTGLLSINYAGVRRYLRQVKR